MEGPAVALVPRAPACHPSGGYFYSSASLRACWVPMRKGRGAPGFASASSGEVGVAGPAPERHRAFLEAAEKELVLSCLAPWALARSTPLSMA